MLNPRLLICNIPTDDSHYPVTDVNGNINYNDSDNNNRETKTELVLLYLLTIQQISTTESTIYLLWVVFTDIGNDPAMTQCECVWENVYHRFL